MISTLLTEVLGHGLVSSSLLSLQISVPLPPPPPPPPQRPQRSPTPSAVRGKAGVQLILGRACPAPKGATLPFHLPEGVSSQE